MTERDPQLARAVTIAGSDSGGGAGIQADLKTFTVLGVYGCSVVTALTAQNTLGVAAVEAASPTFVRAQLDATLGDLRPQAGKTGMLATAAIIEEVVAGVERHGLERLVVDPVMVSKHGDRLLAADAEAALRERLLPRAWLLTPNLPEAAVLAGAPAIDDVAGMKEAARIFHAGGARHVLVKGGHLPGDEVVDVLFDGERFEEMRMARVASPHTHGTGCTLSAAIAALLARGLTTAQAVARARGYLAEAIRRARVVGAGISPVHHLWPLDDPAAARALGLGDGEN